MSILLVILSLILGMLCLFLGLIVLMQRASSNAGMGSALGGGMAESAFGGETGNVLTRLTIWSIVGFFVLSLVLYMGYLYQATHGQAASASNNRASLSGVAAEAMVEKAPATVETPAAQGVVTEAPAATEKAVEAKDTNVIAPPSMTGRPAEQK